MCLSSHPSASVLPVSGQIRSLCSRYALCVLWTEDARVVADEHHTQEKTGNLAQPAGTSEHKESGCYQSGYTQPRHIATTEVAEKTAQHI